MGRYGTERGEKGGGERERERERERRERNDRVRETSRGKG